MTARKTLIALTAAVLWMNLLVIGEPAADLLTINGQGNTLMPLVETEVSMDAERVVIEGRGGPWQVTATFHMRSHAAKPITREVAFPVVESNYSTYMKDSFKAYVGEAKQPEKLTPTTVTLKMKRTKTSWVEQFYGKHDHKNFNYPGYLTWPVSWQPGQTRVIRCTYKMGTSENYSGIVDGWGLLYVVRTGTLWKGPIGKAEIIVRFGKDVRSHRVSTTPLVLSHPRAARWVSSREVRWSFRRWVPKEDITVKSLGWVGLDERVKEDYFYTLPNPYRSARHRYTREDLDRLVEAELAPWKKIFPRQIRQLNRKALRRIIAEWLYREMFARRGDPFLLSRDTGGKRPEDASFSSEGYYYTRWHDRFNGYSYHGGWYKPLLGRDGKVKLKDLSTMEQNNAAFFKRQMK